MENNSLKPLKLMAPLENMKTANTQDLVLFENKKKYLHNIIRFNGP